MILERYDFIAYVGFFLFFISPKYLLSNEFLIEQDVLMDSCHVQLKKQYKAAQQSKNPRYTLTLQTDFTEGALLVYLQRLYLFTFFKC